MFFSDEFVDQDKTELDEFFCRNWQMFHHTFWSSPNPYLGRIHFLSSFFFIHKKKIALFISTARMYTLNIFPQWNVNYYKLHIYILTYCTARHSQMSKSLLISRDMHRLLSVNTDDNPGVRFANFFPWPVIETVVRPLMVQIHRVHFIQFLWHNRS